MVHLLVGLCLLVHAPERNLKTVAAHYYPTLGYLLATSQQRHTPEGPPEQVDPPRASRHGEDEQRLRTCVPLIAQQSIHQLVEHSPVLDRALPQRALASIASLL